MRRMLRSFWLLAVLALLGFVGCISLYPPPPPAPPAPAPVSFSCQVVPDHAARGQEIKIHLQPPSEHVIIRYNGRPIPKQVLSGGATFIVTVPGNAVSGAFEIEVAGRTIPCHPKLTVTN